MTPKIDYSLLGRALDEYKKRGYTYVEAPWVVPDTLIRETLPLQYDYWMMSTVEHTAGGLVGSAEQALIGMDLPEGAYVAVTPCFRVEDKVDLLTREWFMKIELFLTDPDSSDDRLIWDAHEVMSILKESDEPICQVQTDEGYDLTLAGIEIGSYGERRGTDITWSYGTGLALPRFSVADALSRVT